MTQREKQLLKWITEDPLITQQELAKRANITRSSVAVHISNLAKKGYIRGRGYVVRQAPFVAVVGGINIDIGGKPLAPIVPADSNPGRVRLSLGGVARNIAHNLALLGVDTRMVTVLGEDIYAQRIKTSCQELNIDISQSAVIAGAHSSTYLYINNDAGEMLLAVSDMEIYEKLTPQFFADRKALLNAASVVVIDTNVPARSIEWLAKNCASPIYADPVSTAKAVRLKPVLGALHTIKPNVIEAELLCGVKITDQKSLELAADRLLETGLKRVFISLGQDGVFAAEGDKRLHLPIINSASVSTTGCGDAFTSAVIWSDLRGGDLRAAATAGLAASAVTISSVETVNPQMSPDALENKINFYNNGGNQQCSANI